MTSNTFLVSEFFKLKGYPFLTGIVINNSFLPIKKVGDLVFVSSATPLKSDGTEVIGKVGENIDVETAKEAACLCLTHSLSLLEYEMEKPLTNRSIQAVDLTFMLNTTPNFDQHSEIADVASDLLIEAIGENGKHTRSAIGMGSLVRNVSIVLKGVYKIID